MNKSFFLYSLLLFSLSASSQTIDSMMNIYSTRFPQEKIHIHFDKNYYNAGETIWFKAYIMSGAALSEISRNLYTELADDAGNILERKVAPLLGSSAASFFDIPAEYAKQVLHFRAYTTWMLNFDTAFLYQKTIHVISTPVKSTASAKPTSLRFFPEGGDLVAGAESLLAFKATDQSGKPVKVAGTIFNKSGKKVADFATVHYGMGTLPFTPARGEAYTARWKDATGKEQTTSLPAAKENGIVMHLVSNEGATAFTLRKSAADSGQAKKLQLIAHMNQEIVYAARINFAATSSIVNGSIPTAAIPSGILQVTLFDEAERPLQERIVFINNNDYIFDAYINTPEKKLTKRGKNVLQIEVPDTMQANLSIAVTDAGLNVPDENEDNIYSHFLLSSELRGYIYNAGYYFSSYADSVRRQLDLVMLTNGWRRFKWDDLAKGIFPEIKYMPEDYLSIKGAITGMSPSRLAGKQLNMFIQLKDSTKKFLTASVDQQGAFNIPGVLFYDTASISYQFNNDKTLADRVAIRLENGLLKPISFKIPVSAGQPVVYIQDSIVTKNKQIAAKYVEIEGDKNKKAKVLQAVTVKGKTKSPKEKLDEQYTSGLFSGGLSTYSFDPTTDIGALAAGNIFNYLQGRVPGLMINNAQSGNPTLTMRGSSPTLYLNEMQVETQMLSSIPMNDIAYVKVINDPGVGRGGNGAIAIYTKKGGAAPADPNIKGLSKMILPGYSPLKEFYSPDYASTETPRDLDDIRVTLYWNPYVVFDKNKRKATLSFYNNDITKKFRVIIEGVNEAGKLTRIEELIQ